jgi:hypothetical protein
VPSRKSTKKSNVKPAIFDRSDELRKHKQSKSRKILTNEIPRRSTVSEDSDESTETSFKLTNSKLEKQYLKAKEYLREQTKNTSSRVQPSIDNKSSKSYRTATRSGDNERNHNSYEEHATKETAKKSKNTSALNDDRLANDLAKAISDLARKYIKS